MNAESVFDLLEFELVGIHASIPRNLALYDGRASVVARIGYGESHVNPGRDLGRLINLQKQRIMPLKRHFWQKQRLAVIYAEFRALDVNFAQKIWFDNPILGCQRGKWPENSSKPADFARFNFF